MRFLPNSFLVLCVFMALSVVGCKRDVEPNNEAPMDPNEIVIKALAPSVSVAGKATLPTEFGPGSTVGLYTRLKNESDQNKTLQANSYYSYNTPYWAPLNKQSKLTYDENNRPIYLYGYHPNTTAPGASTSFAIPGDTRYVTYSLKRDFSTLDSLVMADFMWSKATGTDASGNVTQDGYVRQTSPVSLPFRHQLCKLSLLVKAKDSRPVASSPKFATIKSIWIEGTDFNNSALLDVFGGTVNFSGNDPLITEKVFWNAPAKGLNAMVGAAEATFVTDMILIPFKVTQGKTLLKVLVECDGRELPFVTAIPVYDGDEYPAAASGNKMRFAQNDFNRITLTIDISSAYIYLDGKIEPWSDGADVDLGTEKE